MADKLTHGGILGGRIAGWRRVAAQAFRRSAIPLGVGLALVAAFVLHAAEIYRLPLLGNLEYEAYDYRVRLSESAGVDDRIAIVAIDEQSLAAEGRWPWGRDKIAQLVDTLFDNYRISLLGLDVIFAEPDLTSGIGTLDELARTTFKGLPAFQTQLDALRPRLDHDGALARSLARHAVVLGYYFNFQEKPGEEKRYGVLPPPIFPIGAFGGLPIDFLTPTGYGGNLAALQETAHRAGHFNSFTDEDGLVRSVAMLYEYKGAYYGALALVMAMEALGAERIEPVLGEALGEGSRYSGLEGLRLADRVVPVDSLARTLVPFRGPQGSFLYLSATDVLHGRVDPAILRGRIIFLGATAPGLHDLRATPVGQIYPGVEVHANLLAGILDGRIMESPAYAQGAEILFLFVGGTFLTCLLPFLSPLRASLVSTIGIVLFVGLNLAVWWGARIVLPLASGLILTTLLYVISMSYGYFSETLVKRQLTQLFGQYVPPELVSRMADDPEEYSVVAQSRELTVLFSDVRGFTTISEGLPATELADLINGFLTPMTHIIHQHRGTIDKYMGDAIMAFWGAPIADPDHAVQAVDTALTMVHALEGLNEYFAARRWPPLRIGVGVNTGLMSVGNMGSQFRMAYTVMGDAVNLGSRLEGLTKTYHVAIIVSDSTRNAAPEFTYRLLDQVRVKGKALPVKIHEPLGRTTAVGMVWEAELALHQIAMEFYWAQEWAAAAERFQELIHTSMRPDLYDLYLERIDLYRVNPPGADWDGTYTHTSK